MEMSSDIETIKWLLVATLVGISLIAVASVIVAVIFVLGLSVLKEQHYGKVFQRLSEDLLSKNDIDELVQLVEGRLESHPQDVWAHWYMGQAKYHKGVYPESKRSFERVLELEPSWYNSIDSWIDKLDEKLDEGPKLVQ